MVLHGNYVYANLFEQNICRNIVIDDSHGPNGPYNTFFRNRAEGYGIFFSNLNSPDQNFIGNDISNTGFPYSLVNYTLLGSGHFIYGNNNKGTIDPAGTQALADESYAYLLRPDFVPLAQWAAIGTPNVMGAAGNPARDRYLSGNIFSNACDWLVVSLSPHEAADGLQIRPNPTHAAIVIESEKPIFFLQITDIRGRNVLAAESAGNRMEVDGSSWEAGVYFVYVRYADRSFTVSKVIKY
jgi:hypothetical protein